jgi:hypothetical protein
LFKQNKISLKELLGVLVNPDEEEFDFDENKVELPYQSLLSGLRGMITEEKTTLSLSHPDVRDEIGEELSELLADYVILHALTVAKDIEHKFES